MERNVAGFRNVLNAPGIRIPHAVGTTTTPIGGRKKCIDPSADDACGRVTGADRPDRISQLRNTFPTTLTYPLAQCFLILEMKYYCPQATYE